jgi:NADPH:quinone reductase-like Zn-dependent oxidoreductase
MKLRYRLLGAVLGILAVAIVWLGYAASHDDPCGTAPPLSAATPAMKAVVYRCYGPPQVMSYESVAKPVPAANEVLVKVHAASVNPLDWHYVSGRPYLVRTDSGFGAPKSPALGVDFAGTVEATGSAVRGLKVGDEVFGARHGAFAEYVSVPADRALAPKPANMSFEQAAAVPVAGVTALQALRDKGHVRAGQKVLINGASGGVGTLAVQIAKAYGAEVTGVCSARNADMVRAIGADHVIDYTKEDFTRGAQRYDLILDTVGNHGPLELRRALTPRGTLVLIGGPSNGNWVGPMAGFLEAVVVAPFVSQTFTPMLAELTPKDIAELGELMRSGKVTPVIDRRYPLAQTAAALTYLEAGHARGKVVIDVP